MSFDLSGCFHSRNAVQKDDSLPSSFLAQENLKNAKGDAIELKGKMTLVSMKGGIWVGDQKSLGWLLRLQPFSVLLLCASTAFNPKLINFS